MSGVTYAGYIHGLDAKLGTKFDGRHADLHLEARDGSKDTLVTIDSENGQLGAGALDPQRVDGRATGRIHGTTNVDLHRVNATPGATLPFQELAGWLSARFEVEREDAKRRPTLIVDGWTRDLLLTTEPNTIRNDDNTVTVVGKSFHSEGLDAHLKAKLRR